MGDVLALLARYSYPAIFGLLVGCGAGLPLSEDAILVAAGVLCRHGALNPYWAVAVGMLGVLAGDLLLFTIGRRLGRRALGHPRLARVLTPARVGAVALRFHRYGPWAVVGARLAAGTRTATFLSAGMLGFPLRRFMAADCAGAAISVPATVLLARAGAGLSLRAALPLALAALGLLLATRWVRGRVAQWRAGQT